MIKINRDRHRAAGLVAAGRHAHAALAFALLAGASLAAAADDVVVTGAWVRATVPGQPVAAAYLSIASARGATLTHVRSDAAGSVQMHSMSEDGGVMRMRELERLELPAGKTVRLAPAGTHLMLLQLTKPLRPGDSVALDLTVVDRAGVPQVVHAIAPVSTTAPAEASP